RRPSQSEERWARRQQRGPFWPRCPGQAKNPGGRRRSPDVVGPERSLFSQSRSESRRRTGFFFIPSHSDHRRWTQRNLVGTLSSRDPLQPVIPPRFVGAKAAKLSSPRRWIADLRWRSSPNGKLQRKTGSILTTHVAGAPEREKVRTRSRGREDR